MTVRHGTIGIGFITQLDAGNIFQTQDFSVGKRTDNNVTKLFGRGEASPIFDGIFVGILVVLAESTRSRFQILLFEGIGHV